MTDYSITRDIEYRPAIGHLKPQHFDLFTPATQSVPGIFVFMHGGGWRVGDKSGSERIPRALAQRGIVTVNANYTPTPEAPYPRNLEDVFALVEYLAEHYASLGLREVDARRIFLGGASSGGHLASLAVTKGLAEQRLAVTPAAVVSWYSPLDPASRFLKHNYPDEPYPGGFWARGRAAAEARAETEPDRPRDPFVPFIGTRDFTQVTLREALDGDPRIHLADLNPAELPPFLLLVGAHDSAEIQYSQRSWHSALRSVGAEATLLEVPGADHEDEIFASPSLIGAVLGVIRDAAERITIPTYSLEGTTR